MLTGRRATAVVGGVVTAVRSWYSPSLTDLLPVIVTRYAARPAAMIVVDRGLLRIVPGPERPAGGRVVCTRDRVIELMADTGIQVPELYDRYYAGKIALLVALGVAR